MRDADRLDPLYEYLKEVHKKNFPDWRFWQFIVNFERWYGIDPYYIEDDKVYDKINTFISTMKVHEKFVSKKVQKTIDKQILKIYIFIKKLRKRGKNARKIRRKAI